MLFACDGLRPPHEGRGHDVGERCREDLHARSVPSDADGRMCRARLGLLHEFLVDDAWFVDNWSRDGQHLGMEGTSLVGRSPGRPICAIKDHGDTISG